MLQDWLLLLASIGYLSLLFAIAWQGDRTAGLWRGGAREPLIYALALAIYCTSWTFFGSVGRAATNGADFVLIYVGPVLVITAGYPFLRKMAHAARAQNVTSIADFIGARYGKSRAVAALVAVVAIIGVLPYIALQLQAVSQSFETLAGSDFAQGPNTPDTALFVALTMAVFAILFGVRHVQASERHDGMILAIAFESLVKLAAFLAAGVFVVFELFDGVGDLAARAAASPLIAGAYEAGAPQLSWITLTLVAACAFVCLPRQFHVAMVANANPANLRTAIWLFPLYLVAINLFVPAIAAAGMLLLDPKAAPDQFMLTLPMSDGRPLLSLAVYIGGLSAATSMVIVSSVAISTMVSNELIVPAMLRGMTERPALEGALGRRLLLVRRLSIFAILLLAYAYYALLGGRYPLVSIGLVSFCAVAQFAPALVGGLYWRRAHRRGAFLGLLGGALVWAYTMLLPTFVGGPPVTPLDLPIDAFSANVLLSLGVNLCLFVAGSLLAKPEPRDLAQADAFISGAAAPGMPGADPPAPPPAWAELRALAERFLGAAAARDAFAKAPPASRPSELAAFVERLLSGAIGAASARIVVAATLRPRLAVIRPAGGVLEQAYEAILYNRDLLRSTIDSVGLGLAVFDGERRLATWNPRFLDLLGFADGDLAVGAPLAEVAAACRARLELDAALTAGGELLRADGAVLEVQVSPMPTGGLVLLCADVTERARAAERLAESEQRIRVYTDNVPALMSYVDREERYRFTNRPYEEALGLEREAAERPTIREVLGEERYRRLKPFIDGAFAGEEQRFEIEFATRTGAFALAQGLYVPHRDEAGRVIGFFSLYQDITEQRRAERALIEAKQELERRVEERTRDLVRLNEELERARDAADAANLGKTRFLAAAGHDLSQPLHAARLFAASLAEQAAQPPPQARLVERIDHALATVEELLHALLEISKLDAGALKPEIRAFALGETLESLVVSFQPMAERRALSLRMVPTEAVAISDPALLRRVLQNLLSNAIRYTERGGVLIGCRRRGGRIAVEVWDTGPGIAEDDLGEVFDEFRRLADVDAEGQPGMGLGLAIVERIARMLGHEVAVRSRPGRGSVFSIALPRGDAAAALPVAVAPAPLRDTLAGRAVLCLDNDAAILEGMRTLLGGWGCVVATAANGAEALAALARLGREPDLMLIDYHLGEGANGFDALDALRAGPAPEAPAVLLTANHTDAVRAAAAARGVPLVTKPAKPAALRALMSQLVADRERRRAAAE